MDNRIREAITALKSGDKKVAYLLLRDIIAENPRSKDAETAWIIMAAVVDDPQRQRRSLETALALNPANEVARQRLAELSNPLVTLEPPTSETTGEQTSEVAKPQEVAPLALAVGAGSRVNQPEPIERQLTISLPQFMGFVGVFLLALGVFTPIIRLPIVGSLNYFRTGQGDGVLVLLLALISLPFLFVRRYKFLWISGMLSLAMITATLGNLIWSLGRLQDELSAGLSDGLLGGLFQTLLESVQLEWGWVVLVAGGLLLLASAAAAWDGWKNLPFIGAGLFLSVMLVGVIFGLRFLTESGVLSNLPFFDAPVTEDGKRVVQVPVGSAAVYDAGSLRVLQVHDPTAFHVIEPAALGHAGVQRLSGITYVSI